MSLITRNLKAIAKHSLASFGLIDQDHDWSNTANFIPFKQTLEGASQAGMSVGDYVDTVMNGTPGSSQSTVDKMASMGMFAAPLRAVLEIGPGTGRYLEKVQKIAAPARYEIYETAAPWAAYLETIYGVTLQPTDGHSLAATPDASIDLVHAHKVFSTIPFIATCCYWHEIARVTRPGGWVAFDIMTENCLDQNAMQAWADSDTDNGSYPAAMSRSVAVNTFTNKGFTLVDSFVVPMPPGKTELLIFRK